MGLTKETLKRSQMGGDQAKEQHVYEPDNIQQEDLRPERVRQAIVYTRSDMVLVYNMLTGAHDQLVRIKQLLRIIAISSVIGVLALLSRQ